jgi:hypothetical protein
MLNHLFPLTLVLAAIDHEAAFVRLKTLAGDWEAKSAKGSTVRVAFRPISSDSALVETYTTASGKETMTVFHPDGARIIATHYCAQGNQPRLALDPESSSERFIFRFADATNLAKPSASHLARLEIVLAGKDRFAMVETYEENGKPDATKLEFSRSTRENDLVLADRHFDEDTAARKLEGWVAAFAPDGAQYTSKGWVTGPAAIRKLMGPLFAGPRFDMRWTPDQGAIAPGGHLGFTWGRYRSASKGGTYLSVWRKQADGSWKVQFDTGDDDP